MNVCTGISAEGVQDLHIIDGVQYMDGRAGAVSGLKFLTIWIFIPVSDKDNILAGFRKSLEDKMAVVLRLNSANRDTIPSLTKTESGKDLLLPALIKIAQHLISAISNQLRLTAIFLTDIILNALVIGYNHICEPYGQLLRKLKEKL